MNKQNLIIYKFKSLYVVFKELEENLNFKIFEFSEEKNLKSKLNNYEDYLIITKKKIENLKNQLVLNEFPIKLKDIFLKLTEKEIDTIVYLHKSSSAVGVQKLQSKVWGYESNLETHTVETHIYRLRKKILQTFNDNNFIISQKNGYQIN